LARDAVFRARFEREAQLGASLAHESIVPVLASGEVDGELYLAMKLVPGEDLDRRLARARCLDLRQAAEVAGAVASALDAAHAAGFVHRDVKPSNVLVRMGRRRTGSRIYLTDFGLVCSSHAPSALTGPALLGTIDYMAPEQIRGDAVDGRADQYSLGCLLYAVLTGSPPFGGRSASHALVSHLLESPPRLSDVRPELPRALDSIVARALRKDPADRFPSCRDLARAVAHVACA